jgi:hypothetical protein
MVSMVAFLVGGAFISLSLNDLTWLTFALVSALDRLSLQHWADASTLAERPMPLSAQIGNDLGSFGPPGSLQPAARSFAWERRG